jgi:3-oxoacyl-[acyl-carrier protein] reductase
MDLLKDRVAVITGGAQGLGLAMAEVFAAHGARIVLGDLNLDAAQAAAERLNGAAFRCDVTQEDDVTDLIDSAVKVYGGIDVMVNNAGVTRDRTLRKMTLEEFRTVVDVHLVGAWLGTKAAGEVMRERGSGSIINISSIAGKVGNFGQTNYSAAKGRHGRPHQGRGQGTGREQCAGERHPAWPHPHGHDRGNA